jgi:hypothetical protein
LRPNSRNYGIELIQEFVRGAHDTAISGRQLGEQSKEGVLALRVRWIPVIATMLGFSAPGIAQEILEVPASKANVARPDDLFSLPPGQWHIAKSLAQGSEPCVSDQCEAGLTTGDLVVSVEHAEDFVRIISGLKGCGRTAYSEVEVGAKPGKPTFRRVANQLDRVVKGLGKTCNMAVPAIPKLDVASMFAKASD